jgi:hypothetical protein
VPSRKLIAEVRAAPSDMSFSASLRDRVYIQMLTTYDNNLSRKDPDLVIGREGCLMELELVSVELSSTHFQGKCGS